MNRSAKTRRNLILPGCLLLAGLAATGLAACQHTPAIKEPTFYDEWKVKAETAQPYLTPRQAASDGQAVATAQTSTAAPAETAAKPDEFKDLPTTPVSIRFVDEEIGNVLRALGRMANQNILTNPSVTGKVNAHITGTPWNEVFMGFINSFNLVLHRDGSLLRVMTLDDVKKQVERDSLRQEKERVAPLLTRLIPVEFANPEEIGPSVAPMLSKDKAGVVRGAVAVDKHSRSLVVTDVEENMTRISSLVAQLDKPIPQILIEAHIVETTQDTARELGIQWGGSIGKNTGRDTMGMTSAGINPEFDADGNITNVDGGPLGATRVARSGRAFSADLPASAMGAFQPAGIYFQLANNLNGNFLDLQLSALQKQGKANIISQPSIVTLDNSEAIIESGREIPYQTVEEGTFKIAYKEATLKLTVTPHVISDRLVKLNINAKKDEVDFVNQASGNPTIIKKQANTQLIVENSATVVIAGLSKEKSTKSDTGIPWLSDIPGMHWLFSTDSRSNDFEEVLIFISPKILLKQAGAPQASADAPAMQSTTSAASAGK